MRKLTLLLSFILLTLFIAGCQKVQPVCNDPYIQLGTGCCLDSNKNNICDDDEKQSLQQVKEQIKAEILEEVNKKLENQSAKKSSKELQSDYCYFAGEPTHLDCRYGFLWHDSIEMKIRSEKSGVMILKKIWYKQLDCGITFAENERPALEYMEEYIIDIPCEIQRDSADANIDIELDFYQPKDTGGTDVTGYQETPSPMVLSNGQIGGIIRYREGDNLALADSYAEGFVIDECYFQGQSDFECTKHTLGEVYIDLRLKAKAGANFVFEKIEFPAVPCAYNFEEGSAESKLNAGEERTYHIPCEMRREFVKSTIEIIYKAYEQKSDPSGESIEGEYEEEPKEKLTSSSWIAGMIRTN